MDIYYVDKEDLENAFKKVNKLMQEEYGEQMIEVVSKELGVPKESLRDKSLNEILMMISDRWNKLV